MTSIIVKLYIQKPGHCTFTQFLIRTHHGEMIGFHSQSSKQNAYTHGLDHFCSHMTCVISTVFQPELYD